MRAHILIQFLSRGDDEFTVDFKGCLRVVYGVV